MLNNPCLSNPYIQRVLKRESSKTYKDFVEVLYLDLEDTFSKIRDYRKYHDGAKKLEDLISSRIVQSLSDKNYIAGHDTFANGHVDINVSKYGTNFKWLGEAKIWKGASYIEGGFKQLSDRYSTGETNENCGGILIYLTNSTKEKNTKEILTDWKDRLESLNLKNLSIQWDDSNQNYFYTKVPHNESGLDYTVKHMVLNLRYTIDTKPKKK